MYSKSQTHNKKRKKDQMDPESGAESLNKKPTTTSIPARGLEPITGNNDKNVFVPASKLNSAGEKAVKTAGFVKPQKGTPPPPKKIASSFLFPVGGRGIKNTRLLNY